MEGKKHEIRRSQPQDQRSSQLPRAVAGGWAEYRAHAVSRSDGQVSQLQLREHHADCEGNPMPPTLQDFALGTRLAASSGVAKRAFSFSPQWPATSAIRMRMRNRIPM